MSPLSRVASAAWCLFLLVFCTPRTVIWFEPGAPVWFERTRNAAIRMLLWAVPVSAVGLPVLWILHAPLWLAGQLGFSAGLIVAQFYGVTSAHFGGGSKSDWELAA